MGSSKLRNREQNLEAGKQYPIPALGTGTSTMTGGCSGTCTSGFNASEALHFPGHLMVVWGFQCVLGMTSTSLSSCNDVSYVCLT